MQHFGELDKSSECPIKSYSKLLIAWTLSSPVNIKSWLSSSERNFIEARGIKSNGLWTKSAGYIINAHLEVEIFQNISLCTN